MFFTRTGITSDISLSKKNRVKGILESLICWTQGMSLWQPRRSVPWSTRYRNECFSLKPDKRRREQRFNQTFVSVIRKVHTNILRDYFSAEEPLEVHLIPSNCGNKKLMRHTINKRGKGEKSNRRWVKSSLRYFNLLPLKYLDKLSFC